MSTTFEPPEAVCSPRGGFIIKVMWQYDFAQYWAADDEIPHAMGWTIAYDRAATFATREAAWAAYTAWALTQ